MANCREFVPFTMAETKGSAHPETHKGLRLQMQPLVG